MCLGHYSRVLHHLLRLSNLCPVVSESMLGLAVKNGRPKSLGRTLQMSDEVLIGTFD